jgi:hypothetical protein
MIIVYSSYQKDRLTQITVANIDTHFSPLKALVRSPEALIRIDAFVVFDATWEKLGKTQVYKDSQTYYIISDTGVGFCYNPKFSIRLFGAVWDNP